MFLNRFRRKKEVTLPTEIPSELPEDLERFKLRPTEVPELPFSRPEPLAESRTDDKIELVLQKLETIDARLRLLEEKMKSRY